MTPFDKPQQFDVGYGPIDGGPPVNYGPQVPPKSPRGCLFYGCVTVTVLGVLSILAVGALLYSGYYYYNKMVAEYSSPEPATLPQVTMPEEQQKALDDRKAAFQESLKKGEAAEIVLDSDDVNALISENPQLKGKVYVTIDDDLVKAELSIPGSDLKLPGLKGRYINGKGSLTVRLDDGEFDVRLRSLEINGKPPLPANVMEQIADENLLKDVKFDLETTQMLRKIRSLTVKDGKIILKSRTKEEDEAKKDEGPSPALKDAAKEGPKEENPASATTEKAEAPEDPSKPAPKDEAPAPKADETAKPGAEAPKIDRPEPARGEAPAEKSKAQAA